MSLPGISHDLFGDMRQDATETRLERLISIVATRQHLKAQNIEVANEDVEKEVNELKRNPPSAGCSCCRYGSLEEFLAANLLTMKDLRECVRNDLGLDKYVLGLWNKEHPAGEARGKLVATERQRVEKSHIKVAHIFFNTAQQPEFQVDPDGVRKKAETKALAAWQRLQAGEDFAKLVQDCSEDAISRPKGGSSVVYPDWLSALRSCWRRYRSNRARTAARSNPHGAFISRVAKP